MGWCGVALSAGGRNCDDGDGDAMMRDEVGGGEPKGPKPTLTVQCGW